MFWPILFHSAFLKLKTHLFGIYNVESVAATIRPIGRITTNALSTANDANEPADAANEHGQPHDDGPEPLNDDANDGRSIDA